MKRTQVFSALVALLVVLGITFVSLSFWPGLPGNSEASETRPASQAADPRVPEPERSASCVVLSEVKATAANIRTQPVARTSMVLRRYLPARFTYDDRRHVAVRVATDAIVDSIHVKPGDNVESGDILAVLRSPAIGQARGLVLQRQAELELAEQEQAWQSEIGDSVESLVDGIRAGRPIATIESEVSQARLGRYGGELLAAYGQSRLANDLSGAAKSSAGAISGRVARQRRSDQQQTRASLRALTEESLFETKQAQKAATAKADVARRSLTVANEALATALGVTSAPDAGEFAAQRPVSSRHQDQDLARLELRSPLTGTVQERHFSASERVSAGGEMFVIADTSVLWVEADIRGRDWDVTKIRPGDRVAVRASNAPDEKYEGAVHYVGRRVDMASGAVPLVIEIDNKAGLFRPGLFARVEVPVATVLDTIAVPSAALIDLDGQASVFLRRDQGFVPIAVEVGMESSDSVQITHGLAEGDTVAITGVFVLKSELLLEGEE